MTEWDYAAPLDPEYVSGHQAGWLDGYEAGQRDKLRPELVDEAITGRVTELLRLLRERAT